MYARDRYKGLEFIDRFSIARLRRKHEIVPNENFSAANELNFSVDSISMENRRYRIICKGVEDTFIFKHSKVLCYSSFGK